MAIQCSEDKAGGQWDAWNTEHHTASGLVDRVRSSEYSLAQASQRTLEFLEPWIDSGKSPCAATALARIVGLWCVTC